MHYGLCRARIHGVQALLHAAQLGRIHQIGLADEDLVSKAHLLARLLAIV